MNQDIVQYVYNWEAHARSMRNDPPRIRDRVSRQNNRERHHYRRDYTPQRRRGRRSAPPIVVIGDNHDEDDANTAEGLGQTLLGTLGIRTTRDENKGYDDGDDDDDGNYMSFPNDAWESEEGHQRRQLLSDWVRSRDPRNYLDDDDNDDGGYLIRDGGGGDDDDDNDNYQADSLRRGRGAQNLDGLFDMDDINQEEMRRALAYQSGGNQLRSGSYPGRRYNAAADDDDDDDYDYDDIRVANHVNNLYPQEDGGRGVVQTFLDPKVEYKLRYRFNQAQARAIDRESRAAGKSTWLVPSKSAQRWVPDHRRIARVFDLDTRIRDMDRAMRMFDSNHENLKKLQEAIKQAPTMGRQQFADFLSDIGQRVSLHHHYQEEEESLAQQQQLEKTWSNPMVGNVEKSRPLCTTVRQNRKEGGDRLSRDIATRRQVGHPIMTQSQYHRPRAIGHRSGYSSRNQIRVSALDVPVFSLACWILSPETQASGRSLSIENNAIDSNSSDDDDGDDDDDLGHAYSAIGDAVDNITATTTINNNSNSESVDKNPGVSSYYVRGNKRFLVARLGQVSASERAKTRADAIRFFIKRYGLDFSPQSGARRNPKTNSLVHASLPAVLEPYTVSGDMIGQIQMAEGHLASAMTTVVDPLGNGARHYAKDGETGRTLVAEAGWMVRTTSPDGLQLPGNTKGNKNKNMRKSSTTTVQQVLPRGGILATGFWILDRPDAPPSILRFQSSGIPRVTVVKVSKTGTKGLSHEIMSRWDIYDMAHDAGTRPYQGIGRGVSVVHIERLRNGKTSHQGRTMITLHH